MDEELLARIEDASLNASAPPQQLWLDGWLVRLSPGKAKRARSVNAVAVGRRSLVEKLAQAQLLFKAAGLPMVVRITPFTQPGNLDELLAQQGLRSFDDTHVLVCPSLHEGVAPPALPKDMHLEAADAARYAELVGALRESPARQRQAHAERLKASPVPYEGWLLMRDDEVLCCGQFARELDLVGLYDIFTAPQVRGQGLARMLCAHLLAMAWQQGARVAYLQVDNSNGPAQAVYRRLGFVDGYRYHYRSAESAAF